MFLQTNKHPNPTILRQIFSDLLKYSSHSRTCDIVQSAHKKTKTKMKKKTQQKRQKSRLCLLLEKNTTLKKKKELG